MPEVIDLKQKFSQFQEHWLPHVLGNVNNCSIKIAKMLGEFPWHSHDTEDELFYVVKGALTIRLRDREIHLTDGQFTIVDAGIEHQPFCEQEVWVMLFEPETTTNTGNLKVSEFTRTDLPEL